MSMPTWLEIDQFKRKYPFSEANKIGQGSYGSVYLSGDYVVKVQEDFGSTFRELNFYLMLRDDHIISLLDWSAEMNRGMKFISYFAFPKGIVSGEAFEKKMVPLQKCLEDVVSAFIFLESMHVCHGDFKPPNLVYMPSENQFKVIDFGIAQKAVRFPGHGDWVTGIKYTEPYRDPEYLDLEYNPIRTETFSIGKTIVELAITEVVGKQDALRISINTLYPLVDFQKQFIEDCYHYPVRERMNLSEIAFKNGINVTINGSYQKSRPPQTIPEDRQSLFIKTEKSILSRILDEYWDIPVQYVFVALDILHRVWTSFRNAELPFLLEGVLLLVLSFTEYGAEIANKDLVYIISKIITTLEGPILNETYWDKANFLEDLPSLFSDTLQIDYDPDILRRPLHKSGTSKDILFASFYNENPFIVDFIGRRSTGFIKRPSAESPSLNEVPFLIDQEEFNDTLLHSFEGFSRDSMRFIAYYLGRDYSGERSENGDDSRSSSENRIGDLMAPIGVWIYYNLLTMKTSGTDDTAGVELLAKYFKQTPTTLAEYVNPFRH